MAFNNIDQLTFSSPKDVAEDESPDAEPSDDMEDINHSDNEEEKNPDASSESLFNGKQSEPENEEDHDAIDYSVEPDWGEDDAAELDKAEPEHEPSSSSSSSSSSDEEEKAPTRAPAKKKKPSQSSLKSSAPAMKAPRARKTNVEAKKKKRSQPMDEDEDAPASDGGDEDDAIAAASPPASSSAPARKKKPVAIKPKAKREPKPKAVRPDPDEAMRRAWRDARDATDDAIAGEDSPAASSSSALASPPRRQQKQASKSNDSDSESDYNNTSGDDDSSDDDDEDDDDESRPTGESMTIQHEVQADPTLDEPVNIDQPFVVGTRSNVRVHTVADYEPKKFTGLPLGFDNKNFPRNYGHLSIIGRLRIDIKDNEIDFIKRNKALKVVSITSKARDEIRIMIYSMLSCQIKTAFNIERGRINKAPRVIPDSATNETMHMYYRCPMGRT